MGENTVFINKVKDWKNFLEYVRDLNIKGYQDYYIEELHISMGVGYFPPNSKYILLSTTKDCEICVVGCETLEDVKETMDEDGGWERDSIWKDDKQLKFHTKLVVEGE